MRRENYPRYSEAIQAYRANDRAALRDFLGGSELSQAEKTLIQVRLEIQDRELEKAHERLERMTPPHDFFSGEREILLGSVYFNQGEFELAALANLRALDFYQKLGDRIGCFGSYYNLSVDFNRTGARKLSHHYLLLARGVAQGDAEKSLIDRALACHFSQQESYAEACQWMDRALESAKSLGHSDRMGLYAVASDIFFRGGAPKKALKILEEIYQDRRSNTEKARIEFEYKVLSCLLEKSALPVIPAHVKESEEHSLKWRILRAVQTGELDAAAELWRDLHASAPQIYGRHFDCLLPSEERSIFFAYFRTWYRPSLELGGAATFHPTGMLAKLHEALLRAKAPLSKESLVEKIWGVSYETSYDARFYKLVERLKKAAPYSVLMENRAYRYDRSPSRKSVA